MVRLSAICDEPDDPLGREIGELLWPEYQTLEFYEGKRRAGGEYEWASNYQQRPVPVSGTIFDSRMLETHTYPTCPGDDIVATCRAWDLAAGPAGDYTVGLKMGRRSDGRYIVLDVVRFRADPSQVEATMRTVAELDGKGTKIALSQDPGQAGKSQIQYLTRQLAGFSITSERETGEKIVRAAPCASQVNIGNVALLQGGWNRVFLTEIATYPSSRNDDQVDALSRCFGVLSAAKQPGYSSRVDFMAR